MDLVVMDWHCARVTYCEGVDHLLLMEEILHHLWIGHVSSFSSVGHAPCTPALNIESLPFRAANSSYDQNLAPPPSAPQH